MHFIRLLLSSALFSFIYYPSFLVLLSHATFASPSQYGKPSLDFLTDYRSHTGNTRSWPSRIRDSVLRTIWRIPPSDPAHVAQMTSQTLPNAPPSLVARYGGDVVLRFNITSEEEAKALSAAANVLFLDVWEFTRDWVDIRLSKDMISSLLNLLPATLHRAHTPLMHDLAQTIFESYPAPALTGQMPPPQAGSRPFGPQVRRTPEENNIFFQDYQPFSVILPWMRLLRSLFPTHVRMLSIGISYEGREIPALRVGVHPTNSEQPSEPRKTIIITGGLHAREWISTSTVNYVAYSFITAYGRDREITTMLEKFDFVFIPTLNPDGYTFSWDSDRLWRKNRQQTALRFCNGLDLDRAFGFQWDSAAPANENPCSESFSGEHPFEAVEARRFADWVRNETDHNNVKFVGFLDIHSYSQQILYPYSYSCISTPSNLETLQELAMGLAKAIRLTHGERYDITSACEASLGHKGATGSSEARRGGSDSPPRTRMETGGGSALDWLYHEMHVPYSYQLKLRDTGSYGFLLPREHIVPTGKEVFKAVEYFAYFLDGNNGIEVGGSGSGNGNSRSVSDDAKLSLPNKLGDPAGAEWSVVPERGFKDVAVGDGGDDDDENDDYDAADVALELRRRRR